MFIRLVMLVLFLQKDEILAFPPEVIHYNYLHINFLNRNPRH